MEKQNVKILKLSFSEELDNFATCLENVPRIDSSRHTLSGAKQFQYSTIDKIYSYLGKLSSRFRELYNSSGPFKELVDEFNLLRKDLVSIIESEKSYSSDYISSSDLSNIRLFFNKASSFISSSVTKINDYRNIYSELVETPKNINDKVFIVHGSENGVIEEIKKIFLKTDYKVVVLEEQASVGSQYIYEKFVEAARPCGFAIVIMHVDDPSSAVFRGNVLIELGYFLGTIGKSNILIVSNCSEDKMPSDIKGIYIHKTISKNWKREVKQSLIKRGFVL